MKFNVALIILYDLERKILLQHRSSDAEILPDYWAFFGGRIKGKETPTAAVYREAIEELNCRLKNPKLMLREDFKEGEAKGRLHVYIEYFRDDKSTLKLQEGKDWGWYSESEISHLKMIDRDRRISKFVWDYLRDVSRDNARKN